MSNTRIYSVLVLMLSMSTAQAAPPESSPLLNELSRYDASFIESVGFFIMDKCQLDIVKTAKPVYMPVDDAFIKRVGLDDAAKKHINNIIKKAVAFGYEVYFYRKDYKRPTPGGASSILMNNEILEYHSVLDALKVVTTLIKAI